MRFPRPRRALVVVASVAAALLLLLVALPYLFRGRIEAAARRQVNASVRGSVNWSGLGLSLLRDFPNVTLSLDGLSVAGDTPFRGDTLLTVRAARFTLDLGSVVGYLRHGAPIVVREVALEQPVAHLRVLASGARNWDITRATADTAHAAPSAMGVTLRQLRVSRAGVRLDDAQSGVAASVAGLDVALSGDFARQRFVLGTTVHADSVSAAMGGIPYLTRVALDVHADVDADLAAHRFTFRNDSLRLNALRLVFSGSVTQGSPNLGLDVAFAAPGTAFHDILSLVPAIYAHDFAQIQTSGTMAVSGRVRGAYGPHAFPALALRATVSNGAFKYPALALPARDIAMELAVDNPGGHVDSTVVNLKRLHAVIGGRPVDAQLLVRTPVSDPDVTARVVGSVNLADVARTVTLDGVSGLAGTVTANASIHARVSDVDAQRFNRVDANGAVQASRVALRSAAVPYPIAVDTAALLLTAPTARLAAFAGRVGNTDARATGQLDNLIGFLLHHQELRGTANVASARVDLDQWKSSESTKIIPVPPLINFALRARAGRVTYGPLTLANVNAALRVRNRRVTIDSLSTETLGGRVAASGFYETTTPARPTFDVALRLADIQVQPAFASVVTVQKIAPIARWARGAVSGTMAMRGGIGPDMLPLYDQLSGNGVIEARELTLAGAPVLDKLASAISLDAARNPTLGPLKATFTVADGRVHVQPFVVKMNDVAMTVAGSNGFDQTIQYDLALGVPRSALGAAGSSAVARLASQAGKVGVQVAANDVVHVDAAVTGTVTSPVVKPSFAGVEAAAAQAGQYVARQAAESLTAVAKTARARVDTAATEAARRAKQQADQLMAKANAQAAAVRAQARALAAKTVAAANARADSLVAQAGTPVAKMAAQAAADRVRAAAQQEADRIVKEGDAKADAIVAQARQQAAALTRTR